MTRKEVLRHCSEELFRDIVTRRRDVSSIGYNSYSESAVRVIMVCARLQKAGVNYRKLMPLIKATPVIDGKMTLYPEGGKITVGVS